MQEIQEAWEKIEQSEYVAGNMATITLCLYLVLAGLFALYIRFLYRKCSASASDTDSISRVFPLLAIIVTAVIAVVKSSLALSLGLVGALSIVRFRAAIKDPEELVFLFLCIAIGLALGAEAPMLAVGLLAVSSLVIIGMHLTSRGQRRIKILLTISGDSDTHFGDEENGVLNALETIVGRYTLQRYDLENKQGQIRVILGETDPKTTTTMIDKLRARLPGCEFSYVNLNSSL